MGNRICLRFQILFIIFMIAEIGYLFIWLRESFDTKNKLMTEKDVFNGQHFASITLDITESNDLKATHVAIACAITSKGMENVSLSMHPLILDFLPTFCRTASPGFIYSFYVR